ncbi:MAG: hypothetical protein ACE5JN_09700 [Candidatus Methylomirabilia bacterium]
MGDKAFYIGYEDGPGRIAEYIEHRLMRERQILQALGGGLVRIPDMVERIYVEVPRNLHRTAAMSVESHLKKLAREGPVRERREPDALGVALLRRATALDTHGALEGEDGSRSDRPARRLDGAAGGGLQGPR